MRKFLLAATAIVLVASATVALANLTSIGVTNGVPTSGTGNVSTIDNLINQTGQTTDTAYAGSGSASMIAALKGLYVAVTSPIPLGTAGGWTTVVKTGIVGSEVTIKSSAGWLGKVQCDNSNAAWSYLQIYNTTSPTVGTTPPIGLVPIAPSLSNGFVQNTIGDQYSTAISVAATTTPTGGTAVSTGLNCSFSYN